MGVKESNLRAALWRGLEERDHGRQDVVTVKFNLSKDILPSTVQPKAKTFQRNKTVMKEIASRWRYISLNIYSSVSLKDVF